MTGKATRPDAVRTRAALHRGRSTRKLSSMCPIHRFGRCLSCSGRWCLAAPCCHRRPRKGFGGVGRAPTSCDRPVATHAVTYRGLLSRCRHPWSRWVVARSRAAPGVQSVSTGGTRRPFVHSVGRNRCAAVAGSVPFGGWSYRLPRISKGRHLMPVPTSPHTGEVYDATPDFVYAVSLLAALEG